MWRPFKSDPLVTTCYPSSLLWHHCWSNLSTRHTSIPVRQPGPLETRQTDSHQLLAYLSESKQIEKLRNWIWLSDLCHDPPKSLWPERMLDGELGFPLSKECISNCAIFEQQTASVYYLIVGGACQGSCMLVYVLLGWEFGQPSNHAALLHISEVAYEWPGHFDEKKWVNSKGFERRDQTLPPYHGMYLPSLPPCLFIHARNVNSYRAVKPFLSAQPCLLGLSLIQYPPPSCILPVCLNVLAEAVAAQSWSCEWIFGLWGSAGHAALGSAQ